MSQPARAEPTAFRDHAVSIRCDATNVGEFAIEAASLPTAVTRLSREHRMENVVIFEMSLAKNFKDFIWDRCGVSGWGALLAAGLLEIGWALGLKYSDGLTRFWPAAATVGAVALSFAMMALALRSLPFGTAYAVWTGIGAVGSILVGMLLYSEPADPVRIICLTLIIAGMIGLKLNSPV